MLLASALFLASAIGLGSPISCMGTRRGMDNDDIAAYCMNYGFKALGFSSQKPEQPQSHYQSWFKWTPIILLVQSVLFYIPHWIWKHCEDGWIHAMVKDMRRSDLVEASVVDEKRRLAAECLRKGKTTNKLYGCSLLMCVWLNLLNVGGQLAVLLFTFSYYFLQNPINLIWILAQDSLKRSDPLELAFPKTIVCNFWSFGPTATVEVSNNLCDVHVNHFNEMFVIFMWYWFVILTICTTLNSMAKTALAVIPALSRVALKVGHKGVKPKTWARIFKHLGTFDLLVLKTMLDEMYPKMAQDFLLELESQINKANPTLNNDMQTDI